MEKYNIKKEALARAPISLLTDCITIKWLLADLPLAGDPPPPDQAEKDNVYRWENSPSAPAFMVLVILDFQPLSIFTWSQLPPNWATYHQTFASPPPSAQIENSLPLFLYSYSYRYNVSGKNLLWTWNAFCTVEAVKCDHFWPDQRRKQLPMILLSIL